MELQTVSHVSKTLGISAQMLRYYERSGLIQSLRKEDYAYRVYDDENIKRLQQIVILRKLQIPIKQIKDILNNQNAAEVIDIFKQNISELDEHITALTTIKLILARFVDELQDEANIQIKLERLNDKTMFALMGVLSFSENKFKEKVSMEELNKASEVLTKAITAGSIFQMQQEDFLFLGKLYAEENINFGKWYEDFMSTGGFGKINPYKNTGDCLATVHIMLPKLWTVYIGIIADNINLVPDGYISEKFSGGEFLVVASEWKPTNEDAHKSLDESEAIKKMPVGYTESDENYLVIEKFYECPEKGHKWERWYPIKRQ